MSDLISKSKLILHLNDYALQVAPFRDMKSTWQYDAVQECIKAVEEQLTVDAEPVIHGVWIGDYDSGSFVLQCSLCDEKYWMENENEKKPNFCPNCGASMKEKV